MNNDLSAEILHVPSSRPAPTPAHPPPVNHMQRNFPLLDGEWGWGV